MDDRTRILTCAAVGAAAGAVFGYLYLCESGRQMRQQIDPWLDDFLNEVGGMRRTVDKARNAAQESWRVLNEVVGEKPDAWSSGSSGRSH
jgi:hypothetical protein